MSFTNAMHKVRQGTVSLNMQFLGASILVLIERKARRLPQRND